jgi:hypothetical protein
MLQEHDEIAFKPWRPTGAKPGYGDTRRVDVFALFRLVAKILHGTDEKDKNMTT